MSDTDFTTDQREREASGGHPYGRYFEEFEEGAVYKHWPAKTVTEADDHLFCLLTMNHHPLHINDVYAAQSSRSQRRRRAAGLLVGAGHERVRRVGQGDREPRHRRALTSQSGVPRDTLFVETEVLEKKASQSKPDRGVVKVHTRVLNQDGVLVAEFKRLVLVPKQNPGQ